MKKSFVKALYIFFAAVFCNVSVFAAVPEDFDFWTDAPADELARAIVDKMTPEELYSQVLMFGWAGAEPNNLLFQWVRRGLGSVKVFGWNTEDIRMVAKSITSLQKASARGRFKIPLFVATDQEGGWVRHVKGETSITPGNMAIGAGGYPSDAWYSAYYISREIKVLGINMNFAPTVDLFTNHDSTIIGTRSFSDNPENAGILGAAFSAGSLAAGVIPTAKHFPGHGDTANDSHVSLPEINVDFNTFKNRELIPFQYLIRSKVPAIMSGHLFYPQIEPEGAPATLSKYFLTDVLRKQLKYEGLIITDDMEMAGATTYTGSQSAAFRMAIEAGNDIVISSRCAELEEPLWTNNLSLVKTDENFFNRVKESAYRVIKAKLEYFKGGNAAPLYPSADEAVKAIPDKEGSVYFLEQALRSITLYKKTEYPVTREKAGRVLLCGSFPRFFAEGRKRYPNSGKFEFKYVPGPNETQWAAENIAANAKNYDTVVVCVANQQGAKIAKALEGCGKRIVIFSLMSPTFSTELDFADEILLGYSWSGFSFTALFAALNGEYNLQGVLPFKE